MNFLSPDDIFNGVRRKSVCNGALLQLSSKHSPDNSGGSSSSTPISKSKKDRRRGSFNEVIAPGGSKEHGGRRASLVARWFKHISDAAEQYKPRSKNPSHEPVDDPAIATLPHSNTRESLELTPERPPPQSATATLVTTPLAPMLPMPTVSSEHSGFGQLNSDVQLRNGRRESTPTPAGTASDPYPPYYNIKQRLSHNELSANNNAVNRTMSTRSCGDANHNYSNTGDLTGANGITLRHTQSARQANGATEDNTSGVVGNKRDSASIVYSNNSNNTRTLMQSSPPLVEPTAIQISINPAHTAEPVLTPAEKLRRLDASIRDGLMEKQKIICDMFRLPVEHFHEIVDIAAMPEAPKDSTDIALAAYAQVQSLTEVMNEYMKVTPEQEVSAVSTAVCDRCHEKQIQTRSRHLGSEKTVNADVPPPLPPPNKQVAQAQQQTPSHVATKKQTCPLEEANIHEDDDGYCEIDELRLPALPPLTKVTAVISTPPILSMIQTTSPKHGSAAPPLPPPSGSFKAPPAPPSPPAKSAATSPTASSTAVPSPELTKRQSTISADSIPEESVDEVTNALNDRFENVKVSCKSTPYEPDTDTNISITANEESHVAERTSEETTVSASEDVEASAPIATIDDDEDKDDDSAMHTAECESAPDVDIFSDVADANATTGPEVGVTTSTIAEPQRQNSNATLSDDVSLGSEHIEINETYECLSALSKLNTALSSMVDNSTQTLPITTPLPVSSSTSPITSSTTSSTNTGSSGRGHLPPLCGPNRIQHANSLEPSVPCYALSSIVSTLNSQISLLLPKINERDMERERLRKENLHLRELLNAMHERQRVESKLETPINIPITADVIDDEIAGLSPTPSTTPTPTPTPTVTTTASIGEDQTEATIKTTTTVEAQIEKQQT